jgi:hypothetical protein
LNTAILHLGSGIAMASFSISSNPNDRLPKKIFIQIWFWSFHRASMSHESPTTALGRRRKTALLMYYDQPIDSSGHEPSHGCNKCRAHQNKKGCPLQDSLLKRPESNN